MNSFKFIQIQHNLEFCILVKKIPFQNGVDQRILDHEKKV